MESWILPVYCKVNMKPFCHQETQSIHDTMNIPKIEFFTNIYIFFINI